MFKLFECFHNCITHGAREVGQPPQDQPLYTSSHGGIGDTIEDRRKRGWGKGPQILGILGEVDTGTHRIEVGLILRKAILNSSLLITSDAWHHVTERDVRRLEQVDAALLRSLVKAH